MLEQLTERERRHKAFDNAICDLRSKYPDFYIEYWSPTDVMSAINDGNIYVPSSISEDDLCQQVIDLLYEGFDASVGTQWQAIEMAIYKVLEDLGAKV